jgi:hypothetical protein
LLGQRDARRIAISRSILRQQVVGQSVTDGSLEQLSGQPAPPVVRVTEYLELRDLTGPAFIAGYGNNPIPHAHTEDSRVGPDACFLPFRRRNIAERRERRQAIAIE